MAGWRTYCEGGDCMNSEKNLGTPRRSTEIDLSRANYDQCGRWTTELCGNSRHLSALIGTVSTGLSTLLAMIRFVLFTLVRTSITQFSTQFANCIGELRASAHQCGRCPADFRTISVGFNAVCHLGDIRFTQTRVRTMLARLSTFNTCIDTRFVILVRHLNSSFLFGS